MYYIGLDVGGTTFKAGVVTEDGRIVHKDAMPTGIERPYQEIIADMAALCKKVAEDAGIPMSEIKSIGVGVPGLFDNKTGMIPFCTNLGWHDIPFVAEMKKHLDTPVYGDNDATVAGLAESVAGVSAGIRDCVFLTLGTGVGGGIIIDGKPYSGAHGCGSEIGHMMIKMGGELCTCGNYGCFERYASATAIIREARKAIVEHPESSMLAACGGDPEKLNANQWAAAVRAAGMKAIILTCKHHDGFCLWPSEYTDYSVKKSKWKDGQGDVVRECAEACKKFGLKFGVYLSPWDRHDPRYGEGEAYNKYFKNQLRELLTNYGDIFCVWFDGACGEGKNGRKQEYDWQGYYDLIRECQPEAVISVTGPDVRWCGNEAGVCRKSEWNVVPYYYSQQELIAAASQQDAEKPPKKINHTALDLGSRKAIKNVSKLIWYPAEVDVSIRKGWFYHLNEDYEVKPLSKLMEIYYNSVGANASLLLNIPPNKDGLFAQRDVETLLAMGAQLQIDFNEDLADDSIMTDSCHLDEEHRGQMALTHTTDEYWHSGFDPDHATLTLDLGDDYDIDKIVLSEHIATGQQIEKFSLYGQINGKWKKIFAGTVIGSKRICRFAETRMQYIKLVIEETRCFATIARFEAY